MGSASWGGRKWSSESASTCSTCSSSLPCHLLFPTTPSRRGSTIVISSMDIAENKKSASILAFALGTYSPSSAPSPSPKTFREPPNHSVQSRASWRGHGGKTEPPLRLDTPRRDPAAPLRPLQPRSAGRSLVPPRTGPPHVADVG